jgi:hypothetical protein
MHTADTSLRKGAGMMMNAVQGTVMQIMTMTATQTAAMMCARQARMRTTAQRTANRKQNAGIRSVKKERMRTHALKTASSNQNVATKYANKERMQGTALMIVFNFFISIFLLIKKPKHLNITLTKVIIT